MVFSRALDALMDRIGLDAAARKAHRRTLYTLQVMLHYFKETNQGDALFVRCRLLEHDDKRMRVWLEMQAGREGASLAASEQLLISVDQGPAAGGARRRAEAEVDTRDDDALFFSFPREGVGERRGERSGEIPRCIRDARLADVCGRRRSRPAHRAFCNRRFQRSPGLSSAPRT